MSTSPTHTTPTNGSESNLVVNNSASVENASASNQPPAWTRQPAQPPAGAIPPSESAPLLSSPLSLNGAPSAPTQPQQQAQTLLASTSTPSLQTQENTSTSTIEDQTSPYAQPTQPFQSQSPFLTSESSSTSASSIYQGSASESMPSAFTSTTLPEKALDEIQSLNIAHLPPSVAPAGDIVNQAAFTASAQNSIPSPLSTATASASTTAARKSSGFEVFLLIAALLISLSSVTLLGLCAADLMPPLPDFSALLKR